MTNAIKALFTALVTLALESIPQAPALEWFCSRTLTGEFLFAIPGIVFLKLFLFFPFYWLSRLHFGTGALPHAITFLLVTTLIAPLFAWNIFFCTWPTAVVCTLLAGLTQWLSGRLMHRWSIAK